MKYFPPVYCAILLACGLTLSACASQPDRRGPAQDRQSSDERGGERRSNKQGNRPAKSAGTFMLPVSALFIQMDSNADKRTSKAEMRAGIQSEWAGFARSPSAIYFADWSIANLGSMDAMPTFMAFDRDFNGVVSETEFSGQIEQEFNRLDKNQDGRLERSEMLIAFAAPRGQDRERGSKSKKGRGQGGGQGGQGGGRPPR